MKINLRTPFVFLLLLVIILPAGAQNKYTRQGDEAFNHHQYVSAISLYKKALGETKNPADRERISFKLAESYMKTSDYKNAVQQLKKLDKSLYFANNPSGNLLYANALQYSGNDTAAIRIYNRYLALKPGDSAVMKRKALISGKAVPAKMMNYKVVNETSVNTSKDEFSPVLASADGSGIVFTSNRKGVTGKGTDQWTASPFSDLFIARAKPAGGFMVPELIDKLKKINTEAHEGTPLYNHDYTQLYCTRCEQKPERKTGSLWCYILGAEKIGEEWADPQLVYADPEGNTGHPALTSDGLTLVFSASNANGAGGKDLWVTTREAVNKPFGPAVNVGSVINTSGDEMFPYFRNDSVLYFASDGHAGYGGLDVFFTRRLSNGRWSSPANLGSPLNSGADDFAIVFKPGMEEGYFSSNRSGGKGGDDIYSFKAEEQRLQLSGKITDALTGAGIAGAAVSLSAGSDTGEVLTDNAGNYRFPEGRLAFGVPYTLSAAKQEYLTQTQALLVSTGSNPAVERSFALSPVPEKPVVLPEILYDLDSYLLLPRYQDSLIPLVKLLKENPLIRIELSSHTDSRADDRYNDDLSQKRAQAVVDYLISCGINADRLKAKGYGESRPRLIENALTKGELSIPAGTRLDEEFISTLPDDRLKEIAHQLNRRTEFIILSDH